MASLVGAVAFILTVRPGFADLPYEQDPINYSKAIPDDPVARLERRLAEGKITLRYDDTFGYLPAVLEQLRVPAYSQALVFSKTSFQRNHISPKTPRAIYFSDDMYVGFVRNGDVLEFSAVDPKLGAVFYTLSQQKQESPQFVRQTGSCLTCHSSSKTADVPGHLVRSVFPDRTGMPVFNAGTYNTNHESPFEKRWGGWYVTGKHGSQRHMGNVVVQNQHKPNELDTGVGANVTDLASRFDTSAYLSPHSDIVALMMLEHQTHMQNLITHAGFEGQMASWYNVSLNKAFNEPLDRVSDSTVRRLNNAAESLLKYLLFVDEMILEDPVEGTSEFSARFAEMGPRDSKGRSLRDLDLRRHLFKYPCSYLIYGEAFDSLPKEIKERFYRRLFDVLTGEDQQPAFTRLSSEDRRAILDILRETKSDLPDYWKTSSTLRGTNAD